MSSTRLHFGQSIAAPRAHVVVGGAPARRSRTHIAAWVAQGLLAALFLFAGGMKLVMPADALAAQSHLPGAFMKFIGVAETLGALGLVLPGLTGIRRGLTPWAAGGLLVIMVGATIVSLIQGPPAAAAVPVVVGGLATFIAFARRTWRA